MPQPIDNPNSQKKFFGGTSIDIAIPKDPYQIVDTVRLDVMLLSIEPNRNHMMILTRCPMDTANKETTGEQIPRGTIEPYGSNSRL